jgi:hypothetical protein
VGQSDRRLEVLQGDYDGPQRTADVVLVLLEGGKESNREWNGKLIKSNTALGNIRPGLIAEGDFVPLQTVSANSIPSESYCLPSESYCLHSQWVLISYANPPSPHCRIQCLSGCQFIALVSDEKFAEMNRDGFIKQAPGPPPFIGKW